MRRASPSLSPNGSACRSTASITSPTIPTGWRRAAGRIRAARCAWRASSSARRPTRSSTRAARSPASCFETDARDIEFRGGWFAVEGTDRRSASSRWRTRRRREATCRRSCSGKLDAVADQTVAAGALSLRRAHLRGRGRSRYRRGRDRAMVGVDDVGRAINPLILHGQTHGAAAQGDRPGAARDLPLRPRRCAIALGLLHGLRDAARRRSLPILRLRAERSARRRANATASARAARAARRRRSAR